MKEITCIVCPNGCRLKAEESNGGYQVTGGLCKRGAAFAIAEMTHPMRSLTTTVATAFADMPRLSVKASAEIPKENLFEAMALINRVCVKERVKAGDIVLKDVFGASFIATADL
jgi:CxxC motif-containing protein